MSWDYSCPKCSAALNPDRSVILRMSHDDVDCLVGIHPQPGKYEVYLPPEVTTEEGTAWDFSCPMCSETLRSKEEPNLCELRLTVDGDDVRIFFSRIAGEHATFICHEDQPCEEYGPDAGKYAARKKKELAERS